jgi:phytoene/squalene synthetase
VDSRIENPAAVITKSASQQSYYTVRFLADRDRVDDAYRAYGYFRWVDDILDSDSDTTPDQRLGFLARQKDLLERCYRGEPPREAGPEERMLVEMVRHDREAASGLQAYLRNMMRVMEFDAGRRGTLISHAELNEYTHWLAVAVTEALHYFIGHDKYAPRGETRYLAVSAAHIAHMLRDTYDDVRAGYFNIPREVLEAHRISPADIDSAGYRAWTMSRVRLARSYFRSARAQIRQVESLRCRLAGFAYTARFEWMLDTIEREGYILRPSYDERKGLGAGVKMIRRALSNLIGWRGENPSASPAASHQRGNA